MEIRFSSLFFVLVFHVIMFCGSLKVSLRNDIEYDEKVAIESAYLSAAAYCNPVSLALWNCSACRKIPFYNVSGVAFDPISQTFAYIAVGNNRAVLSFRGTDPDIVANDITDLVSAIKTSYSEIPGAEVGSGFFAAYSVLKKILLPQLDLLLSVSPNIPILVTGHSLGGALAQLAAVDLFLVTNRTKKNQVTVITFGSPRVGNKIFSSSFNSSLQSKVKSVRITHAFDPVVHLPLEKMGFIHSSPEVWYILSMPPSKSLVSPGPYKICIDVEDQNCADGVLGVVVSDHLSYLGIPISSMCCNEEHSCEAGYWGLCCKQICPFSEYHCNCPDDKCAPQTGTCYGGCSDSGLCKPGFWGWTKDEKHLLCDNKCDFSDYHCGCPSSKCASKTGTCYGGCSGEGLCISGYWGWTKDGKHLLCNNKCDFDTNHCACPDNKCGSHSGTCFSGCSDSGLCKKGYWGWSDDKKELKCDKKCDFESYHCNCPSDKCGSFSGTCFEGCSNEGLCKPGYWGWSEDKKELLCDKKCDFGTFHCGCPKEKCGSYTGTCFEGCSDSGLCEKGFWGWNGDELLCNNVCPACKGDKQCHSKTGLCRT